MIDYILNIYICIYYVYLGKIVLGRAGREKEGRRGGRKEGRDRETEGGGKGRRQ